MMGGGKTRKPWDSALRAALLCFMFAIGARASAAELGGSDGCPPYPGRWRGPAELVSAKSGYSSTVVESLYSTILGAGFPRTHDPDEGLAYENRQRALLRAWSLSDPYGNRENLILTAEVLIQFHLAQWYLRFNLPQKVLEHAGRLIEAQNNPKNDISNDRYASRAYLWRGNILRRLGRYEEALADFENAQKLGCRGLEKILADISTQIAAARRSAELAVDAQRRGAEAEQKGDVRGALGIYTQALGTVAPGELPASLVAKAIDAAAKLSPPPPIPQEARKHAVFAQTAFKEAKSTNDFNEARAQYSRALALAPWWADAWVTLSAVHEQLGNFAAAVSDLENYLRAAPRAPDRDEVQNKIYELQYKAQRGAK